MERYRFYVLLVNNSQVRRACGVVTRRMGGNSFPHHKALKYFRIVSMAALHKSIVEYSIIFRTKTPSRAGERLHLAFRIDAFLFSARQEDCVASTNTGQGTCSFPSPPFCQPQNEMSLIRYRAVEIEGNGETLLTRGCFIIDTV